MWKGSIGKGPMLMPRKIPEIINLKNMLICTCGLDQLPHMDILARDYNFLLKNTQYGSK